MESKQFSQVPDHGVNFPVDKQDNEFRNII